MNAEWINKKDEFEIVDVRDLCGNVLPIIQKKAALLESKQGLCIIQSFVYSQGSPV